MLFVIPNETDLGPSGSLTLLIHLLQYFKGITCTHVHLCVCASVYRCPRSPEEVFECSRAGFYVVVSCLIWILGT